MKKALLIVCAFLFATSVYHAQITVDQSFTIDEYVNDILLGTGVQASNITYTGSDVQIGYMQGGEGTIYPMTDGLVLSSEHAGNLDPTFAGGFIPAGEGVSGDADLLDIANSVPGMIGQGFSVSSVNDLCILEFDFIATGDTVKFNYSFGSDEYLEWVNSSYNDIFSFFLSGPGISGPYDSPGGFPDGAVNIASVPGTDPLLPITISSVNDQLNSEYYIDNINNDDIAQDGFTIKLVATHTVTCGETYHIKLAIGDGSDTALESIVVLEAGSFTSNSVVEVSLSTDVGGTDTNIIYEDCGIATLTFTRPIETILEVEEMVFITYQGTAESGIDYTELVDTVIFAPFVEIVSFELDAFEDGLNEGTEFVQLEILNLAACNGGGLTSYFEFFIADFPEPLVVDGYDISMCIGDTMDIEPIITGGYGNYSYEWNTGDTDPLLTISPLVTTSYNVIVSDTCGMPSDDGDINVEILVFDPLEISIDQGDITLACNGSINLTATTTGGDGMYEWGWADENGTNLWGWQNTLWYSTWQGANEIEVEVEDGCGFIATDVIEVSLNIPALIIDLDSTMTVLCNDDFTVDPDVSGGEAPYFFNWYVNGIWNTWTEAITYSTAEDVTLTVDVQDNCGQSESIDVEVIVDSPAIEIVMDDEMIGSCIDQFNIIPDIVSGSGGYEYTWTESGVDLGNNPSLNYQSDNSTTIDLVVNDQCGETSSDQIMITIVNPPVVIELGEDIDASCVDNTVINVDVLDGSGGYEYTWFVNNQEVGTDENLTWQSFETFDVFLQVTDACGGASTDEVTINIPDIPLTLDLSPDTSLCFGGTANLTALAGGGEEGFIYYWQELEMYGNTATVSPYYSSIYTITAVDICGETITGDINVNVLPISVGFTTTYLTETQLEFNSNSEPECVDCTYYWDFGDGGTSTEANPIHEFDGLADYDVTLQVFNSIGCPDNVTGIVHAPPNIYIPNAFSPNNDGVNDVFQVVTNELISFEISIFNRWGQLVYHSEDPNEVWQGDYKDGGTHYVPLGTYSYIAKIKGYNSDAIEKSGHINVIR